jgi:hypothetical protein
VAVSALIGTSLALLFFSLTENRGAAAVANLLLLPGAALAEALGSGAHDLAGLLLYILGNIAFYAAIPMSIFVLLRLRRRGQVH